MHNKYYTIREDNMIKTQYTQKGAQYIAEKLKRSPTSVRHRASRLNVPIDKKEQFKRLGKLHRDRFDATGQPIKDIHAWQVRVLIAADYICADCNVRFVQIAHAHHIIPRYERPDLTFDVNNGICLCPNCHAMRHYRIGKKSAGRRLTEIEKLEIKNMKNNGHSKIFIAQKLGFNQKTVARYF